MKHVACMKDLLTKLRNMSQDDIDVLFTCYVIPIGCFITCVVKCIYDFMLR